MYMRNQLPPIVDVAMIVADNASMARFQNPATPPLAFQVPASWTVPGPSGGLPFSHSADLDYDLNQFGLQLTKNHIRFRVFRSSVDMESAAWVNSTN
jgi:uncharacterized protein (TIGR02599 family)